MELERYDTTKNQEDSLTLYDYKRKWATIKSLEATHLHKQSVSHTQDANTLPYALVSRLDGMGHNDKIPLLNVGPDEAGSDRAKLSLHVETTIVNWFPRISKRKKTKESTGTQGSGKEEKVDEEGGGEEAITNDNDNEDDGEDEDEIGEGGCIGEEEVREVVV